MSVSLVTPEWEQMGIPEDDSVEPEDANIAHDSPEDNQ